MTSSKLAIADKQEILRLYCETDLSTAKLSKQFGISTSSTLRLLQEMMSPEEYREAVQRKQAKPKKQAQSAETVIDQLDLKLMDSLQVADAIEDIDIIITEELPTSTITAKSHIPVEIDELEPEQNADPEFDEDQQSVVELANELVGENILDIDDDDEFDEDDDADEEETDDDESALNALPIVDIGLKPATDILVILPLDQAELSNICYIVVDKASEIVTRPMRDFKDLGKVPTDEINLLALPVFDNHRAARRFSTHNQKVIKFPSSLIHATKSHLSQKGITRLLYGGQIFAL